MATPWRALGELEPADLESRLDDGSAALLAVDVDDDENVPTQQQLLHALRLAQLALKGLQERAVAAEAEVGIVGDLPIFVGGDSADVQAHPELFLLGDDGRPEVVAGCPPDMFSPLGQRWGNPHYDWGAMQEDG